MIEQDESKQQQASETVWRVAPSKIHGRGLFAVRKIEKNMVIGRYEGPIVEEEEDGDHVLWIEEECGRVYGVDGRNEMRYVNHSLAPNASFDGEDLVALQPIEAGEEITHDYGDEWSDVE